MAIHVVRFAKRTFLVVPAVALLAAACGGDGPTPPPIAASVTVAPDAPVLFTRIGDTISVVASPKDASGNAVSAPVTFKSSDPAVATVSASGNTGVIVSRGFGTATITVSAAGAPDKTLQVRVGFNANSSQTCSNLDIRIPRIELQSAHLIIASDVNNPPNGFTTADYQYFADTFESLVWPVLTQNFGTPSDVDKNGKVIAFFTRAVNELTEPNSDAVVGGFFFGRDLFPKTATPGFGACVGSNVAEMFYMLVPDPTGVVNQNTRTLAQVRGSTVGVMGHEMQHLINSGRRLYVNANARYPEVSYMEEGLSHIAEEMMFYAAAERSPRSNFSRATLPFSNPPATPQAEALLAYMRSNLSRFSSYLRSPHDDAPYQNDDDLATRGATWSWLRYLADHETASPVSIPSCAQPASLSVGGYCGLEGSGAAQFGVAGGSGSEFTIVAFADGASVQTSASASPAVNVSGPPNPSLASYDPSFASAIRGSAAMLPLDAAFHGKLRALERRDLPGRVAYARAIFGRGGSDGARMQLAPSTASSRVVVTVENVWSRLVNSNDTGMTNLRGVFGTDVPAHTRDWAVANYTDDAGLNVPAQFTHPSWNFRDILRIFSANNDAYPLEVRVLTGTGQQLSMVNGGAAYWRLGVPAGNTSTVTFTVNGAAPPANLKLVVVRTK